MTARSWGADVVVAILHYGTEYEQEPSEDQMVLSEEILNHGGVDVILGSRARVVQPIGHVLPYASWRVKDKYVSYSLGDFLSAQPPELLRQRADRVSASGEEGPPDVRHRGQLPAAVRPGGRPGKRRRSTASFRSCPVWSLIPTCPLPTTTGRGWRRCGMMPADCSTGPTRTSRRSCPAISVCDLALRRGPSVACSNHACQLDRNEDTPSGCDARERGQDARSGRSGATGATEDDASRRTVRTRRPQLHSESSFK